MDLSTGDNIHETRISLILLLISALLQKKVLLIIIIAMPLKLSVKFPGSMFLAAEQKVQVWDRTKF